MEEKKLCIDCDQYDECELVVFADDEACEFFGETKPNGTECRNEK